MWSNLNIATPFMWIHKIPSYVHTGMVCINERVKETLLFLISVYVQSYKQWLWMWLVRKTLHLCCATRKLLLVNCSPLCAFNGDLLLLCDLQLCLDDCALPQSTLQIHGQDKAPCWKVYQDGNWSKVFKPSPLPRPGHFYDDFREEVLYVQK